LGARRAGKHTFLGLGGYFSLAGKTGNRSGPGRIPAREKKPLCSKKGWAEKAAVKRGLNPHVNFVLDG